MKEEELSILAASLADSTVVDQLDYLHPEDFELAGHRSIYAAMRKLREQGKTLDVVLVMNELRDDRLGLVLASLTEREITTDNIPEYARIIKEESHKRRIAEIGKRFSAVQPGVSADALQAQFEAEIIEIGSQRHTEGHWLRHYLAGMVESVKEARENPQDLIGLDTGFDDLNARTGGFQKGDLIVVGARPGMGKTALILNMFLRQARQGFPVLFFSLEMSGIQCAQRIVSLESQIPFSRIRDAKMSQGEFDRLLAVCARLADLPIVIDETPALPIADLLSRSRRWKATHDIRVIGVDYLQLVTTTSNVRFQEVSEISRSLKSVAKQLQVPVLALSQLSRGVEQRDDKRPLISDLRESGQIEQDADLVLMLYRDEQYYGSESDDPGVAELNIAKARNGVTETLRLSFSGETMLFGDMEAMEF